MSPHAPDPCVIVIFGASGDLTCRKLIPALYEMDHAGALPAGCCVLGTSRTVFADEAWRETLEPWVREHAREFDEGSWRRFAQRVFYQPGSATEPGDFAAISARIDELCHSHGDHGNVLFYLAVAPSLYEPIVERIGESGLVGEGRRWCSLDRASVPWRRIVVEKPLGNDVESAAHLNRAVGRVFEEDAVYRIDHYLGKELVQNLLVFRFANTIFEPLWNHRYIDHVQITAAETVGVGHRARFYDEAGAVRDMIQSHLLQVLALVAMEPPPSFSAHHVRQEKIKVIDSIKPAPIDELATWGALGQFAGDADEPAYHLDPDVPEGTTTETFAALKFRFDNWRWSSTPFYLRTGKRMAAKRTEIVLEFKQPPASLFRHMEPFASGGRRPANRIVIEIAPREGVSVRFEGKVPGAGTRLDSVTMDFDYARRFRAEPLEAYGPLLLDVMRGDQTLFKHRYEVEGAWRSVMPFLGPSSHVLRTDIAGNYAPGSWGPANADALMEREGRAWHNPEKLKGVDVVGVG